MKAVHKIYTISGAASFSRVHCESARAVLKTQIHTMFVAEQENNFAATIVLLRVRKQHKYVNLNKM